MVLGFQAIEVEIRQGVNLNKTDLDSKGRPVETFTRRFLYCNNLQYVLGQYSLGQYAGQYFTPRPIVKLVVDVLNIKTTNTRCT
jgi:type I restriction enzyme M protein